MASLYVLGYHGKSGPMKIADFKRTPLVQAFLDAGIDLGYKIIDINGAEQLGKIFSVILGCLFYFSCFVPDLQMSDLLPTVGVSDSFLFNCAVLFSCAVLFTEFSPSVRL